MNKGKEIPRDLFVEFPIESGHKMQTTIQVYYRDQPYFCKRCNEKHIGDCSAWENDTTESEQVKELKRDKVKTAMIGDSNLRCINEKGLMTTVTAIMGGK